jgi:hypothetical protein
MAGECFDEAWKSVIKARDTTWDGKPKDVEWHYQQRQLNNDIDAVVDNEMKDFERKNAEQSQKTHENPTGNSAIARVLAKIRGEKSGKMPEKPPASRQEVKLSPTLKRLHESVRRRP